MDFLLQTDRQIFLFINNIQNKFLDIFFLGINWITEFALIWIFICFLIAIFDKKEKKRKIFVILVSLVVSFLIVDVLFKSIILRSRPYLVFEGVKVLGKIWTNSSFPSGHVASSAAVITAIMFVYKIKSLWKTLLLVGFLCLIAFSRIYSGFHYPLDVIAGAIIGVFSALAVVFFNKKTNLV